MYGKGSKESIIDQSNVVTRHPTFVSAAIRDALILNWMKCFHDLYSLTEQQENNTSSNNKDNNRKKLKFLNIYACEIIMHRTILYLYNLSLVTM
jgi:hypothetical protein